MRRTLILAALLLAFAVQDGWGQIPQTMSHQGILTDASGQLVPDGTYSMTFKLYDTAQGGNSLWTETQDVVITNGIFNVILGSTNPLALAFDKTYWLGIVVGGDPELVPRIELTSSAYSLNTRSVADSIITSEKLAKGSAVRSLNTLTDDVTLAEGDNITITQSDNTLRISASAAGGNTLDQAYDQGGAGAGRTITADAGAVNIEGSDGLIVNGNVGIGTTAPGSKLHISGGNLLLDNTKAISFLDTGGIPRNILSMNSGNQFIIGQNTYGMTRFQTGGGPFGYFTFEIPGNTEVMRITSSGSVGIGTYNPTERLQVTGTIYSTTGGFKFPDGTTQTTAAAGGGNTLDQAYDQGGAGVGRTITADAGAVNIAGPDGLTVTGNVGIGTTEPKANFDVRGPILGHAAGGNIWSLSPANRGAVIGVSGTSVSSLGGYGAVSGFMTSSDPRNAALYGRAHDAATGLYIQHLGSGKLMRIVNTNTEHFTVTNNGSVGIGITDPTEKLQVAGTIHSTSGGFKFPDGTVQSTAATGSGGGNTLDQAYDQGGAGAGRTITADAGAVNIAGPDGLTIEGKVGIGATDLQDFNLKVEGKVGARHSEWNVPAISALNPESGGIGMKCESGGDAVWGIGNTIGVRGEATSSSDGFAWGVLGMASNTDHWGYGVYGDSYGPGGIGVYGLARKGSGTNYAVRGKTNSPDGFGGYFEGRGYFSGNVGIGTTTPAERLDVAGMVQMTGFRMPTGAAAGYVLTSDGSGLGTWQQHPSGIGGSEGQVLYNDGSNAEGSEIYFDDTNNRVGINEMKPLRTLHVQSEDLGLTASKVPRQGAVIEGETTALYVYSLNHTTGGSSVNLGELNTDATFSDIWSIEREANDLGDGHLRIRYGTDRNHWNNTEHVLIQKTGEVGIGTGTPTEMLDVNGNVHASGSFIAGSTTTYADGTIDLSAGTDLNVDSGTLFIDNANDRVGIGTNNPQTALHITQSGSAGGQLMIENTVSADNLLSIGMGDAPIGMNHQAWFGAPYGSNGINDFAYGMKFGFHGQTEFAQQIRFDNNNLMTVKTDGKVGIRTTDPTAILDVNGITGYDQLRMRTSYTPTGTADPNGNIGDMAWDDDYIYVKTSAGWKRAALNVW